VEIFYHYSHFLEALIGVYFGGLALLSFIEDKASVALSEKIQLRTEQAKVARLLAKEYFRVRVNADRGGVLLIIMAIFLTFAHWIHRILSFLFKHSFSRIERIGTSKTLQKKFFPSFFYTGVFCLYLVLMSAMQESKINTEECKHATELFTSFYIISSLFFLFWALIIHPLLVNKIDYLHLIFIGIVICFVLIALSIISQLNGWFSNFTDWYLNIQNEMKIVSITLILVLSPIILIFLYSMWIFASWESPIIIRQIALYVFRKRTLEKDIEDLKA
jgi:hypothetical protein